ncbi:TonB-dependent receptor [Roseateles asaccharophilus]|uniref:Iron complex outermembrane receptor protein n=1 Tax=Roseateles asaccharophilus TaxID=582607 RepID=A0ABU2A5M5_9BURK|nr:TonB-dependent receptor [Roseateles asaccharophilus]MDR7331797.1 iron complex outermembrane receptor protein [Roseateles asaccharophilus]
MPFQLLRIPAAAALVACGLPAAYAQNTPAAPAAAASAPARMAVRPATPDAKPSEQLQRVEVSGTASDDSIRKASTASKIVITREEIEKFGDSTVGEVLKRLPGVTTGGRPGRGGDVRMRGMGGGFTQILVDGERMPPGFSLDQLPPEQVERIEVLRAPTAEYGTRAIAGTINVVLREPMKKRLNEFRAGVGVERGKLNPNISWSRNDTFGQGNTYNFSVNAMRGERIDDVISDVTRLNRTTGEQSLQVTRGRNEDTRQSLNLNGRVQIKLSGQDSLTIQPFVVTNKSDSSSDITRTTTPTPATPLPGDFDRAQTTGNSQFTMGRLNAQWMTRPDPDTRIEVRGGVGGARGESHSLRQETLKGAASRQQEDTTDSRDRNWNLVGKFSRSLENEHNLVFGAEGEGNTRHASRTTLVNGAPQQGLGDFGDDMDASTTRFAAYAQDEWNVGKQWDFYAGLRWEGIKTESSAANYAVSNTSSVFTPLAHARYKLDPGGKEAIRMSLTRSYRSPQLNDLIARPSINSNVPHDITSPDRAGNPELKPELATGVEIGYEKYLSKGGLLSANFFARSISNLMRNVTALETVSWSATPRWVARPRNLGKASTMGLELEAKFRLDEYFEDALPINVRSNLSFFTSKVDGLPGPNNRIEGQPKATANLGFDYRLRSVPVSLGASLNWTPSSTIQQTVLTEVTTNRKLVSDAFVTWNLSPEQSLRLSASNLTPLDYYTGSISTTDALLVTSRSGGPSYTQWQVRWEMKI